MTMVIKMDVLIIIIIKTVLSLFCLSCRCSISVLSLLSLCLCPVSVLAGLGVLTVFQRRVPVFGSMFSNLVHHPRYTLRLDPVDPVPPSVDRFWPGHTEQRRQALQHLTGSE